MELSIEQALQQGVAAHKEGKLQDAENLYRLILQTQPKHSLANHCMGVLAVSVNETQKALPLFKTAVEVNPEIEQFWLSYVDALIRDGDCEKAKCVIEQGKQHGLAEDKVSALVTRMKSIKSRRVPSESELSTLGKYFNDGQFSKAEELALSLTQKFPKHQFGWKVLGALFGQTARYSDALNANQKAILLSSKDFEAQNNLGGTKRVG